MLGRGSRQTDSPRRARFQAQGLSHVGKVRSRNEDAYLILPEAGLTIVADGMGGHRGGDVASQVAVDTVAAQFAHWEQLPEASSQHVRERLSGAVQAANRAIYDKAQTDEALHGMGTTLVVALFHQGRVIHAHVGDSRLYRLRSGRMRQLTRDHSLMQQLIDTGLFRNRAEAKAAGVSQNVLTRSVGLQPEVEVDLNESVLAEGDLYLLCTDGLTGKLGMADFMRSIGSVNQNLKQAAVLMCADALRKDGSDNITLVLARPV